MEIVLTHKITLRDAPEILKSDLRHIFTLPNPKWVENNQRGRWNHGVPETLVYYDEEATGFTIPRGYMRQLINACRQHSIDFTIDDQRPQFEEIPFTFHGELKPFQVEACEAMLKKHFGVLTAPTGSGKTVMGIYLIAARRMPTLIIVHTKDLAFQWIDRLQDFLQISREEIGLIGAGKAVVGSKVTVAMVQSLYKRAEQVISRAGFVIVDECHRTPSRTFSEAVTAFNSYYMTGLSATPYRRDKLSKLIFWHLGDQIYQVDKTLLEEKGDILQAEVIFRPTDFDTRLDASLHYTKVIKELTADVKRNTLIASDVAAEVQKKRGICLVLSDRKSHCEILKTLLAYKFKVEAHLLNGDLTPKQRQTVFDDLKAGKISVLIATSQLLGEGFDERKLAVLFLTTPVKYSGRLLQYLGRILRPAEGKQKAIVYDYVDVKVGVLEAAARSRQYVYQR